MDSTSALNEQTSSLNNGKRIFLFYMNKKNNEFDREWEKSDWSDSWSDSWTGDPGGRDW